MSLAADPPPLICVVVTSAELGGAERMLVDLLQGIPPSRFRFHVVLPRLGRLALELDQLHVSYEVLSFGGSLSKAGRSGIKAKAALGAVVDVVRYLWLYTRMVVRLKPRLVYTHGLKAELLTGIASHWLRLPVVWHLHTFVPKDGWLGRLHRYLQRRTRMLVANSKAVSAGVLPPASNKTKVVYCGVDIKAFLPQSKSAAEESLHLTPDASKLRVGMVSVLAPWKGLDVFLRAVQPLLRADARWQAMIVGDPIYDTAGHQGYDGVLKQLACDLEIADRVVFLPYQQRPASAYACLDIFVHAAKKPEPFGRVIAEAMCMQRAVIATAGGGAIEQIESGVDGLLVAMDDVGALRAQVARLMADATLRHQLGLAARSKVLRQGSMAQFTLRMATVLDEAIGARPPHAGNSNTETRHRAA
jgi:glycosyltransferase involved in cell wall biosynthesis